MNESNQSRRALITGASSGIGAEFAKQLHAKGYQVTLVARRVQHLQDLTDSLNNQRPESAEVLSADLIVPWGSAGGGGYHAILEYISSNRIDVLVNNAGFGSFGHFESLPIDREIEMIKLNVEATVRLAHAVIPQMKARRQGAIISVSSIAGFQPLPYMATYSATKAFNLTHSLSLRYELQPFGIQVLSVCPGPTATEFQGVSRVPGKLTGGARDSVEEVVKESVAALEGGQAWVVPCWRAKLLSLPSRLLPRTWCTYLTGKALRSSLSD